MLDIVVIKNMIQEFALKYHFMQQSDVDNIENAAVFDCRNYDKIHGRPIVLVHEYSDRTLIQVGTVFINTDKDDDGDEEFYSIDTLTLFFIRVEEYSTTEAIMEVILSECNKYLLID